MAAARTRCHHTHQRLMQAKLSQSPSTRAAARQPQHQRPPAPLGRLSRSVLNRPTAQRVRPQAIGKDQSLIDTAFSAIKPIMPVQPIMEALSKLDGATERAVVGWTAASIPDMTGKVRVPMLARQLSGRLVPRCRRVALLRPSVDHE